MSKKINEFRANNPYCVVCGTNNIHIHHIKTKGSGGSDEESNLLSLCPVHHSEVHTIGRVSFAYKYDVKKIKDLIKGIK